MCHEPVIDTKRLPKDIEDRVYRPGADEKYNVNIDFTGESGKRDAVYEPREPDFEITTESE